MKEEFFKKNEFIISTVGNKDDLWFSASEVCISLGLSNASQVLRDHCNKEGVRITDTLTSKGMQKKSFINESNLYRIIFRSKKPKAKEFQDWIVEEVLPSIRKTGKYQVPQNIKEISTKNRNILTELWKSHGCTKPYHYSNLTKKEYEILFNDRAKKKENMSQSEILTLSALESMEALALFHGEQKGYYECAESLEKTSKLLPELKNKIEKISEVKE